MHVGDPNREGPQPQGEGVAMTPIARAERQQGYGHQDRQSRMPDQEPDANRRDHGNCRGEAESAQTGHRGHEGDDGGELGARRGQPMGHGITP